ncbi:MAG: DUF1330 domain-containing protein [Streptomycetaceae bacterium]|nr:DUF1330 domain-containing protein [Streptomycetaceae bacterium]
MTAYAFAHIRSIDFTDDVATYVRKIDATLPAYGGRFLVHNKVPEVMDGVFEGWLVLIEFPSVERAKDWYHSDGYQEIVAFRVDNAVGGAAIVDGVGPDYRAASMVDGSR